MIVDSAVYQDGKRRDLTRPLGEALAACRSSGGFVWIGLHEPTGDELAEVVESFGLHPLAVEDAVHPHQRPKLDIHDGDLFLVVRTATYLDPVERVELGEVMTFVGTGYVVTVCHGLYRGLAETRTRLESDPARLAQGPSAVVHALVDVVIDDYERVIDDLDLDIDQIEVDVFSGETVDHTARIFKLKREIVEFRRAVLPLRDALQMFADGRAPHVDVALSPWFRDVLHHHHLVSERLEAVDSVVTSALTANAAQVGVRQNEDMRKISAWVAMAAVPTTVAGIYGMNFEHMPELEWRYGYHVVVAVLLLMSLGLYGNFRRRGWL